MSKFILRLDSIGFSPIVCSKSLDISGMHMTLRVGGLVVMQTYREQKKKGLESRTSCTVFCKWDFVYFCILRWIEAKKKKIR